MASAVSGIEGEVCPKASPSHFTDDTAAAIGVGRRCAAIFAGGTVFAGSDLNFAGLLR
jgi:hypothetical protein